MAFVQHTSTTQGYADAADVTDLNPDNAKKELLIFVPPSGTGRIALRPLPTSLKELAASRRHTRKTRTNEILPRDRDLATVFRDYPLRFHMNVASNFPACLPSHPNIMSRTDRRYHSGHKPNLYFRSSGRLVSDFKNATLERQEKS